MTHVNPGRPEPGENLPYYDQYIALVPDGDIIAMLGSQIAETADLLVTFTEAQAAWRPAPGEWNAKEIVGHLADTERVFVYRALRFSHGDPTPLEGVEQTFLLAGAEFAGRPLSEIADEYVAVRRATLAFLRSLSAAAWTRSGVADGTPISVRALAYIIAGHELHHLLDLRRIPDRAPTG